MRLTSSLILLALLPGVAFAAQLPGSTALGIGKPATQADLSKFFAIKPAGTTLPDGHGSVEQGKAIFANSCAMCHGEKLQGIKATGAPPLIGGRGTLTKAVPLKTTESYWPYATTLFDYIKRAMPFNAPGSLSDDQVYALTAYILAEGDVVKPGTVLDRTSLPAVVMPNRDGFRAFHGPDPRLYH